MPILSIAPCYTHLGTQEALPSNALGRERETENCTADLKGFRSLRGAHLTERTFSYNSQANALGQVKLQQD